MHKITTMNFPEEFVTSYETLKKHHKQYLSKEGVKLPEMTGILGCTLTILYQNLGSFLHIDTIKEKVRGYGITLRGGDPVQPRHLSTQRGWWVIKKGGKRKGKTQFALITHCHPIPGFISKKRLSTLDDVNWQKMKEEYQNMCVNCGSKEGGPLRWKRTETCKLQQGHMDPRKDLTYDNCIPQCSFCNQQYKNKAVFNVRGMVIDFNKAGF